MMKRLFSIILVAFMFVFALSVSAADVDTIAATASKTEVNPGDTFDVTLKYEKVQGFVSVEFNVVFDNEILEVTGYQYKHGITGGMALEPQVSTINTNGSGKFGYTLGTSNYTGKDCTFLVLSFKVSEDAMPTEEVTVAVENLAIDYMVGPGEFDVVNCETTNAVVSIPLFDLDLSGVAFEGAEFPYDGTAHSIEINGTLPTGVEVQYDTTDVSTVGTYTVTATFVDTNSPAVYNVEGKKLTADIVITPAEIEIDTLDVDNKTVTFTGVVDGDVLNLDFDAIYMEKYEGEEDEEGYWLASGFVLTGEKADNYTLVTEEFEIAESAINSDNVVTVTLVCVCKTDDETTEEVFTLEFYKGVTYTLTVDFEGFTFSRWEIEGEKVGEDAEYEFVAAEDFEIYAYLEGDDDVLAAIAAALIGSNKKVKVYFDTIAGSQVHTQTVIKGECVVRPVNPTKGNLTFAGWYTDKDYKTLYDFDEPVTESMTLYAKWDAPDNRIIMTIDRVEAMVFGENVANDVPPIIVNDRTMLPARFVAESLGAKVSWDIVSRKATIVGNGKTIEIIVGETTAYVNGNPVTIDSPAFIRNDRTYTPVRFIAEALGAEVEWVAADRQVIITK